MHTVESIFAHVDDDESDLPDVFPGVNDAKFKVHEEHAIKEAEIRWHLGHHESMTPSTLCISLFSYTIHPLGLCSPG